MKFMGSSTALGLVLLQATSHKRSFQSILHPEISQCSPPNTGRCETIHIYQEGFCPAALPETLRVFLVIGGTRRQALSKAIRRGGVEG